MESSAKEHCAMLSSNYLQQQAFSHLLCCPKPLHSSQILLLNFFWAFSLPWKNYMAPTFGDKWAAGEIKTTPCLEDSEV